MIARPDLTKPRGLSKSELMTFDWCQTEAWWKIHDPRPFVPVEPVTFGSAVDRGCEVYMTAARAGLTAEDVTDLHERAWDTAWEKVMEDGAAMKDAGQVLVIAEGELRDSLRAFHRDIIPSFDWTEVRTQASIKLMHEQLGDCEGHPDIIFADNRVADIKTGSPKPTARTLELGFYALLVEAETGQPVPSVSYIFWNRKLQKPKWGVVTEQVTDELRRWAYEGAAAYVRAKKADAVLNAKAAVPQNFSFPGGPAWAGKCTGCVYSPANGGPCARAYLEEAS